MKHPNMNNFSASFCGTLLLAFLVVNSAKANPFTMTLKDSDGTGYEVGLSIADNSLLDSNPLAGAITYSGTIRGITGVFTGVETHLNGMPSFEFSGKYSNSSYAGLIGYLYFGDFGPTNPETPVLKDTISIETTGVLNFTHQTFEDSQPTFDWGSLGTFLTDQRSYGGNAYVGVTESAYSGSPGSFSQLISIASDDNSATSFTTSSFVCPVPENFSTLGVLIGVLVGLFGIRSNLSLSGQRAVGTFSRLPKFPW